MQKELSPSVGFIVANVLKLKYTGKCIYNVRKYYKNFELFFQAQFIAIIYITNGINLFVLTKQFKHNELQLNQHLKRETNYLLPMSIF